MLTISFMKLAIVPIVNPIVIPIKIMVTTAGKTAAAIVFGIVVKSNGNIDSKVKTTAIPNRFKIIRVISRSMYLSKIIRRTCPIIERINVTVKIGSHALKSSVRIGYPSHRLLP